jgi:hypothetical protein
MAGVDSKRKPNPTYLVSRLTPRFLPQHSLVDLTVQRWQLETRLPGLGASAVPSVSSREDVSK